jgi:hypothetical protein
LAFIGFYYKTSRTSAGKVISKDLEEEFIEESIPFDIFEDDFDPCAANSESTS